MDQESSQRIIKNVNYSFYSALTVIFLVIVLYFASLYSQEAIVESNEVKTQILKVNESLLQAESLQRAYIIIRDENLQTDYRAALDRLIINLDVLQQKISENPVMLEYLSTLKPLLDERIEVMNTNLIDFVVGTSQENQNYKGKERIKKLIAEINDVRDGMLAEENRLLAERRWRYDTIFTISLIVLALGILLMIYSLYMLRLRLLPLFKTLETQNNDLAMALVARDQEITLKEEQTRLNDELILQLEEKNEQLNQFAYIASHDLQEPLRTVNNFIDLFKEDYEEELDEEASQYFSFIKGATSRMNALIDGLLNYSRLGRSQKKSKIDLNQIIDGIKADYASSIEEKKAQIIYSSLPVITGYPTEIRQLFANLISNALKFTPAERQPIIEITAQETSKEYIFKVSDNGLGIKEQHLAKIFKMFTRLHSSKNFKGTGIGLAFCKKIIDLHRGKIDVQSTLGEGSTFSFSIKK